MFRENVTFSEIGKKFTEYADYDLFLIKTASIDWFNLSCACTSCVTMHY